jgi:PIN domain nuclease of toxin-antitoxin system
VLLWAVAEPSRLSKVVIAHAGFYHAEHRDPFNRLLAAQAELTGCPLLTIDKAFADFPIAVIW